MITILDIFVNGEVNVDALNLFIDETYPDDYIVKYKISESEDFIVLTFKDEVKILSYWELVFKWEGWYDHVGGEWICYWVLQGGEDWIVISYDKDTNIIKVWEFDNYEVIRRAIIGVDPFEEIKL